MCGGKPEEEAKAEKEKDAAKMKAFFSKEEQAPTGGAIIFHKSEPLRALTRAAEGP